jgi:hypothetical protein
MFKRLTASGVNLAVLIAAVVVFLGAFLALSSLASAQKPPTVTILAASHDLPIGQVLTAADLVEKTVYVDDNAVLYIPADQIAETLGGVTALPVYAGQPLLRSALIAPVGEGQRLAAALSEYPNMSLFPLPLEESNVVAPDAAAFLPGDLVGITVVIGTRPQPPMTPTPQVSVFTIPGSVIRELPTTISEEPDLVYTTTITTFPPEIESEEAEALARAAPPLAKDLFPQGVMVIAVQGLPQTTAAPVDDDPGSPTFASLPQEGMLILLVPSESREQLALAMQRADRVFVSLLARGNTDGVTPGFTYWDFEKLFATDRQEALGLGIESEPTSTPASSTPTAVH